MVTLPDALTLLGLLLLATGLGLWSVPLMLTVLGVVFLLAGLWSHHRHDDPRPPVPPAD